MTTGHATAQAADPLQAHPVLAQLRAISRRVRAAPITVAALLLTLAACAAMPTPSADAIADLAPTGRLRAVINLGNPILANLDPSTGQPVGVSVDMARALAKRLDVDAELLVVKSAGESVDALATGRVDVGFFAIDPTRAATTAYSAAYVQIEGAYLVRSDSPLRANEEVDRPGLRVAVGARSAYDLYLSRELKAATIMRAPTSPEVVRYFLDQQLDVAAGVKQQLEADAGRTPGLRLLPGRFMVIQQAMGMAKGKDAGAAYLAAFVEHAKASGFVEKSLQTHGIAGATVAPAAAAPGR
jgi:polar amino acid transport system substrate-binding protein